MSDGTPEPPQGTRAWALWRSHNFEGVLIEKVTDPYPGLKIEMDRAGGAQVAYTVTAYPAHEFVVV